jgi:Ca2+-binding RTX toxin-like protein
VKRIVIHGLGGDDFLFVNQSIDVGSTIDGGSGNDRIWGGAGADSIVDLLGHNRVHAGAGDDTVMTGEGNDDVLGGAGNDILLGGAGNDLLAGGAGRDLLVGGLGSDRLFGNGEDDILIGGTLTHAANSAALSAIMAEWTSSRHYADRVANLRGTGSGSSFASRANADYYLTVDGPTATVRDDDARDVLSGNSGHDWFFANLDCNNRDSITDRQSPESTSDLDPVE